MSELSSTINKEQNPETEQLSELPLMEVLELLNAHDASVAVSINKVLPDVAKAVELIASQMRQGGRLFYVGAGTSGRLGVLDSAECPLLLVPILLWSSPLSQAVLTLCSRL